MKKMLKIEKDTVTLHGFFQGWLAQLVRAPARHAGGHKFESCTTHLF
jgi:hypothetical protein